MENSLFVKCQCSTHCFEVQRFVESYGGVKDEGFYLTFWSYGRINNVLTLKERLRWVWNILKTGNPWSDGIIIDDTQAREILKHINSHLNKQ